ncbi:MAG: hypothetical protein EOO52_06120 [Gammaproteobacteria bacterium]|nr:MAG: hypothetical protein EOO52_06120 [Gammaproteobacteria bacterium]
MTIHAASKHIFKILIAISFVSFLAGCGGGSSGPKKDSTPDAFTLTPVTNAAVATEVTSAPVTLSGFNQTVSISISGGTYSIGGSTYTSTAATITSGQTVTVKVTASAQTNTAVSATLTVGGVSGVFTVTTAPDTTPDSFSFTDSPNVGASSVNTSNEYTVSGIDVAVPISITNGEYSINGGTYTNAAGTVSKNQKVTVRVTASAQPSADVIAVLTIGGGNANYKVTTYADDVAPTAQILFPPPVSMTEGNTILVRGSASDEFSAIAGVKVNGVAATTTDGFKNWQVTVPLTDTTKFVTSTTENTLKVTTEDAVGNKSTDAAHVAIRQAPLTSPFPDADGYIYPAGMEFDKLDGRNRLLVTGGGREIYSVDLGTGKRSLFVRLSDCSPSSIVINPINKHAYAPCNAGKEGTVVNIDLTNPSEYQIHTIPNFNPNYEVVDSYSSLLYVKDNVAKYIISYVKYAPYRAELFAADSALTQFNIFSSAEKSIPDAINPIQDLVGMALDKAADRFLVTDDFQQTIFSVDVSTGVRSIFSSNAKGTGEAFAEPYNGYLTGIAVDEVNNRALAVEHYYSAKIFSIDLASGNRSLLTSTSESNPFNSMYSSSDIKIASPNGYAFVATWGDNAVFAVDLVTGHRVVFSKYTSEVH